MVGKQLLFKSLGNRNWRGIWKSGIGNSKVRIWRSLSSDASPQELAGSGRRPEKAPFTKNLFLGKYDREVLIYPEISDAGRTEIMNFGEPSVRDNAVVRAQKMIDFLKTYNDAGLATPYDELKSSFNATECLKISEILDLDPLVALLLELHYSVIMKTVVKCGSDSIKETYLPKLRSGEWFGSYGLYEEHSGYDPSNTQTVVSMDRESGCWVLNGQKLCLVSDPVKFFIVFAKSQKVNQPGAVELSGFLVDKDQDRLSIEPVSTLGLQDSRLSKVSFDNVQIPKENILLGTGEGYSIASDNFSTHKFIMAACVSGTIKKVMALLTDRLKKQINTQFLESELLKKKLAEMAVFKYTLDSMIYLTAGLIDRYTVDTSLESAIIQAFSFKYGLKLVNESMNLIGISGYKQESPYLKLWLDLKGISMIAAQPCETYKFFVALTGLQYAGNQINDVVNQTRNPFDYPSIVFRKIMSQRRQTLDEPNLNLELYLQLHPSLKLSAEKLEYCVLRLQFAVETLLTRHGASVINRHLDLLRLSDAVFDIFAMTCVLSRASRSYCSGIMNSDQELVVANMVCQDAHTRVKSKIQAIIDGTLSSNDAPYIRIGNDVLTKGGYPFEHPLTRNIN